MQPFPRDSAALHLNGPLGPLEAIVEYPEDAPLPLVAVICHPLPTEGGTMHNKVVTMTARALRELGAITVRFNFRGVGTSAGTFDAGNGEVDDVRAVVKWVRSGNPHAALWLAGFSFGAYVSIRAADALEPQLLLSIAPPAGRWDFAAIAAPTMPWLVFQGEQDEIVDPQAVDAWLDSLAPRELVLVKMPETSHFFHRKLMDLRGAIKHAARPYLPERA